jgi:hypothetical protein
MHKLIFLALPFFILLGTASLNAQDASKKENQNKEHHATKDTTAKKDDCCSTDKKGDCCADDKKTDKEGKSHENHGKDEKASVKTTWNAFCPVSGEKIEEGAKTIEIDGKNIAVCCAGCESKLKKDPAKYLKNLSEDGQTWLKK